MKSANPVVELLRWLAHVAFSRVSRAVESKRRSVHRTAMPKSRGKRLDEARRASRPGSPERVGFRRSDIRHPQHPMHLDVYHASSRQCDCCGVGSPREALKP